MNNFDKQSLRDMLIVHEGLKLKPYKCTAGKLTIGVGRNLDDRGITKEEALLLCDNDIESTISELETLLVYKTLNPARKIVIADMCYNLGLGRLLKFKKMFNALHNYDYNTAADEMLDSKWARQVGRRARFLSKMMRSGSL